MDLRYLYKLASLLDSQGKYVESDVVYDSMLRIAAPDGRGRTQGRPAPRDNRNFRLSPQQVQQRINPNVPGLVPVQSAPPVAPQVAANPAAATKFTPQQLNSWTMNVVWGMKPIGFDVNGVDENITGFTSNKHVSTKQFLGYTTSSGQTFTTSSGTTVTNPTSYKNSYNEVIEVTPEEQRCIAVIHYSELGDLKNDPERF